MKLSKVQLDQYISSKIAELHGLTNIEVLRAKAIESLLEIQHYLQTEIDAAQKIYAVGDTGPNGGIVFAVSDSGASGLECRLNDEQMPNRRTFTWHEALAFANDGWYVPSKAQLDQLYKAREVVPNLKHNSSDYNVYWSATEFDVNTAFYQYFGSGHQAELVKSYKASVRLVKGF